MKKYVDENTLQDSLSTKKDIVSIITNVENPLVLSDNTEYRLTNITSLTFSYPEKNFEVWMNISFSSTGTVDVVFPSETKYIGIAPSFANGETWEISIKDGVAICWRIE